MAIVFLEKFECAAQIAIAAAVLIASKVADIPFDAYMPVAAPKPILSRARTQFKFKLLFRPDNAARPHKVPPKTMPAPKPLRFIAYKTFLRPSRSTIVARAPLDKPLLFLADAREKTPTACHRSRAFSPLVLL